MSDAPTSLPVEFLFTMHATLAPPVVIPEGPHGTRVLVSVTGGTVTGPRVNGTLYAAGGDWVTIRKSGSAQLDVRVTLSTDDGAAIYMSYLGILGTDRVARVAPLFQTSHENYLWLNDVQAVGIGKPGVNEVTYDVYALQ
jgi:hypothetical protein